MSWIKVRKNNREYTVSVEAYKELFKRQGYEIVEDKKPIPTQPVIAEKVEKTEKVEKSEEVKANGSKPKRNSKKQS